MPMKLSDFTKVTKTFTYAVPGTDDSIEITYRVNAYTPTTHAAFREELSGEDSNAALAGAIVAMVERWDLQEDDGTPIPITRERLRDVPNHLIGLVFNAVAEDMRPPTTPPSGSFNT